MGVALVVSLGMPAHASGVKIERNEPPPPPDLLLEGGRKLVFERIFDTDRDVGGNAGSGPKF
jgi:hypothetical protein